MGNIRTDSYPLRRWFVEGSTDLPGYKVLIKHLVDKYKVCYFCGEPVKIYENPDLLKENNK